MELVILFVSASLSLAVGVGDSYYIGTGRHDITGPSVQIEMVRFCFCN